MRFRLNACRNDDDDDDDDDDDGGGGGDDDDNESYMYNLYPKNIYLLKIYL